MAQLINQITKLLADVFTIQQTNIIVAILTIIFVISDVCMLYCCYLVLFDKD